MNRKRWQAKTEVTPELLKFREKRKWQIALRRYVIEKSPAPFYAPYFGLDIENLRKWFEYQFNEQLSWETFAKNWQFDHIIPVTYFDSEDEKELKMCWNFTNLRVEPLQLNKNRGNRIDILWAKGYFRELYEKTNYRPCKNLLDKIDRIEASEILSTVGQQAFIMEHADYLHQIEGYNVFEFELLNHGRTIEEVKKEVEFLKKL